MKARFVFSLFLGAGFAQTTEPTDAFSRQCEDLVSSLSIPNVTVNILEYVANGTNLTFPDNHPTCLPAYQLVYGGNICRVAMYVSTSDASGIILEAWLPETWNGRFLSAGNGGLNGCIGYDDIAYANSYGFAAVAANNGHNGTGGQPFYNSPNVVEDFAYRSVHTGVVVGKQLTEQFYGEPANKSYYLGCSTGGRQGMKSAQAFPEDFDGIVAGAPAFNFNALISWSGVLSQRAGFDNTSSTFVTRELWQVVHQEIMRQCDGLDGAQDGIIEDPDLCQPIFSTLLCGDSTSNKSACLNSDQVARVESIFQPLYGENGTLIYPRFQPGGEVAAYSFFLAGSPFPYTTDWFRYVVYNNPDWDPRTLSQADISTAMELDPYNISTWSGDLTTFKSRGGKIITYHGLQDQLISSDNSARYYSHLTKTMGLPPADLDDFYRYFRISGLAHCRGGAGAWDIGQEFTTTERQANGTPQDNVLLAIVDWVENNGSVGPEYMRGYFQNSTAGTSGTRKHCKYPLRNVYSGSGEYEDEDNWTCGV